MNNDPQTYAIIGAAFEVHTVLGHGFLESVYHEALAMELTTRKIPFTREVPLCIRYKQQLLSCTYKADFVCFGEVLVELKALAHLSGTEEAQVLNYLKASGLSRGLLLNFGAPSLEHKRLIFTPSDFRSSVKSVKSADVHRTA
jgi:GxxExxY protein